MFPHTVINIQNNEKIKKEVIIPNIGILSPLLYLYKWLN